MGWDKYIELDDIEYDGKEYETYCSAAGYMVLVGYDPEKSERFVMVADAAYHFDKNAGKESDLVAEALKDGTFAKEVLENSGIEVRQAPIPHSDMNENKIMEALCNSLQQNGNIGYSLNFAMLSQYPDIENLDQEAIAFPPETTVEKLRKKYPDGPGKPKKQTTTRNGLHGASVGFRKY